MAALPVCRSNSASRAAEIGSWRRHSRPLSHAISAGSSGSSRTSSPSKRACAFSVARARPLGRLAGRCTAAASDQPPAASTHSRRTTRRCSTAPAAPRRAHQARSSTQDGAAGSWGGTSGTKAGSGGGSASKPRGCWSGTGGTSGTTDCDHNRSASASAGSAGGKLGNATFSMVPLVPVVPVFSNPCGCWVLAPVWVEPLPIGVLVPLVPPCGCCRSRARAARSVTALTRHLPRGTCW